MKLYQQDYKVIVISAKNSSKRKTLDKRLAEGGIDDYVIVEPRSMLDINESTINSLTNKQWKTDPRLKNEIKNSIRMATYLTHVHLILGKYDEPIIVLDDDIVFKKRLDTMGLIPERCLIGYFDANKIEHRSNHFFGKEYSCGWCPVNSDNFRVWNGGGYMCVNPQQCYNLLLNEQPKQIEKLYIDCFQKNNLACVYLPHITYPSHK